MKKIGNINIGIVGRVLGIMLFIESAFMLTSVPFTFYYGSSYPLSMIGSSAITFLGGFILYGTFRKKGGHAGKGESIMIVTLSWTLMAAFGGLPYLLSHVASTPVDAFFESMSGFTTTGTSIIIDKESVPNDVLYWRSLSQWMGGLGTIVFTTLILSSIGLGGHISSIQGSSFNDSAKIHPHFTSTIKWLTGIYFMLTAIEFVLLSFGNFSLFESLCCSFSTLSSGGFSPRNDSAASMNAYMQYVVILFMMLSGTNFVLVYMLIRGKVKALVRNEEFKIFINIIFWVGILSAVGVHFYMDKPWEQSFRETFFTTVSLLSTTGYTIVNYLDYPSVVWVLMFMLVLIGGCVGSTAGGVKVLRHTLLLKNSFIELRRTLHPNAVMPPRINGKSVPQATINRVSIFVIIFMFILVGGVAAFSIAGIDFNTSIGMAVSNLCNVGTGIGNVGPCATYTDFSPAVKIVCTVLQLFGRLDILTVMALFTRSFWVY